jgi:hypothetical protein
MHIRPNSSRPVHHVAAIMLAGWLVACTNQLAARQAYLSQFVGQPEVALVQQMGVPSRSLETGGVKFLAYDENRIDIVPSFPSYSPYFTGWYGGGFPPQVIDLRCETTFEVVEGTVRSFNLRGNACG